MHVRHLIVLALVVAPLAAHAADFDRTLPASRSTDLYVSTNSGHIHIYPGSDSEVHIKARVYAGWNAGGDIEERIRRISANPPLASSGSAIHVGEVPPDDRHLHNDITIDYEISAPKTVALNLRSGSGYVTVDNLGRSLKAEAGSGYIHARGIAGPADLQTGSGDIELQLASAGEVHVKTGSGSIHINGLAGTLTASTGSGDIEANGNLSGPSKMQSGSGSIRAHVAPDSHLTVDASTGSGDIHIAGNFTDHHHLSAPIHGGGPPLEAHTGSGNIEIN